MIEATALTARDPVQEWREAKAAREVERLRYWQEKIPLRPSPALDQLAEIVFGQSTKRSPIWKFRIASDLIVSIQPKVEVGYPPGVPRVSGNLTPIRFFKCRAVEGDGVNAEALAKRRRQDCRIGFVIRDWQVKRKSIWNRHGETSQYDPPLAVERRVVTAFERGFFEGLQPQRMLGHHCVVCGKGLTDPVSMARLIGPECFGSSSANLPWVLRTNADPT
jgi:Family of unknown function (DUF6011)